MVAVTAVPKNAALLLPLAMVSPERVSDRGLSSASSSPIWKIGYLFPCETDSKRPIPKVNNAHDRALKASKVAPFRLYDLRHTWATRAAESGIDLVTLAAMLGHSKIQMVTRYAHPTQDHQTEAMERFERFTALQQIEAASRQQGTTEMQVQ